MSLRGKKKCEGENKCNDCVNVCVCGHFGGYAVRFFSFFHCFLHSFFLSYLFLSFPSFSSFVFLCLCLFFSLFFYLGLIFINLKEREKKTLGYHNFFLFCFLIFSLCFILFPF